MLIAVAVAIAFGHLLYHWSTSLLYTKCI